MGQADFRRNISNDIPQFQVLEPLPSTPFMSSIYDSEADIDTTCKTTLAPALRSLPEVPFLECYIPNDRTARLELICSSLALPSSLTRKMEA